MRPVYVREMKELSPALALLVAFAVISGASAVGHSQDSMLTFPAVGGLALGILQGALDRWRRSDLFALHRPISAARMECARLLAGATVALAGLLAFAVSHRFATLSEIARRQRQGGTNWIIVDHRPIPEQRHASELVLIGAIILGAWAAARFCAGAVRTRWALPALVALPLLGWAFVADVATIPSAAGVALLLGALFSFGSWLCLAGDRR